MVVAGPRASVQKPTIYVYSYIEDATVSIPCHDSAGRRSTSTTYPSIRTFQYQWVARFTRGSTMPDLSDRSELNPLAIYNGKAERSQKGLRHLTRARFEAASDVWSGLVRDAFQKKMSSMGD